MSQHRPGRLSQRPEFVAARAALDGAVSAFLDLDTRQSYVADSLSAVLEVAGPDTATGTARLTAAWRPIAERCLDASSEYLTTQSQYPLTQENGRAAGGNPVAAQAAYTSVHRKLADAAVAVDRFYQEHAGELEHARSARAAAPQLAADARAAAAQAEQALSKARADHIAFPSLTRAGEDLIRALTSLAEAQNSGELASRANRIRRASAAVQAAVTTVDKRIAAAATLAPSVRSGLASVRTRVEAVETRLETLPATQSALRREFAAASIRDLSRSDDSARAHLAAARTDWGQAQATAAATDPDLEKAADLLTAARRDLTAAEADYASITDRLRILRETRSDPTVAEKRARFTVRDAQRLVVDRGLIPEWGSVLDAQSARIDRAVEGLVGPHPDYWGYLQALAAVESFVRGVIDRVRAAIR